MHIFFAHLHLLQQQPVKAFTWTNVLMGSQEDWVFLVEVAVRSVIMYVVTLLGIKLLGKRGVKQLSIFEMVVIISLGSAAGDPMFYQEVGPIPCVVVFVCIVLAYRLTTWLVGKSERFERLVEGTCTCLIQDGCFAIDDFKKEPLAHDEFFSELRQQSVSHLGQIEQAIIETSGEISIFFYPDEEVKYGLPVLSSLFNNQLSGIAKGGIYACSFCGHIEDLGPANAHTCTVCGHDKWVLAINRKRIS